jgi:hypothetical protein
MATLRKTKGRAGEAITGINCWCELFGGKNLVEGLILGGGSHTVMYEGRQKLSMPIL